MAALDGQATLQPPVRAEDLAARLGVTPRTIYREMDALRAAGVDITGTRGQGYRATQWIDQEEQPADGIHTASQKLHEKPRPAFGRKGMNEGGDTSDY